MKVGLIGAPGSGKTDIAKRLVRNLNRDQQGKWIPIDGYVEALSARTGREYSIEGDISHNVQVMAERWTKEAEALHKGYSTVTCGTMTETIVYTALTRLQPPPEEALMVQFMHEARISMQFLALMDQMTFNYDAVFFIPLPEEQREHDWASVIDQKIPEVLEGVRYALPLTGKTRSKVTYALEVIRLLRDASDAVASAEHQ